ncbi:hypothetical protein [Alkalihalobacterium sp. APHAB7]
MEFILPYWDKTPDLITVYLETGNSYSASLTDIGEIINGQTNHFYISLE